MPLYDCRTSGLLIQQIQLLGSGDPVVDAPATGGDLLFNACVLTVDQRVSATRIYFIISRFRNIQHSTVLSTTFLQATLNVWPLDIHYSSGFLVRRPTFYRSSYGRCSCANRALLSLNILAWLCCAQYDNIKVQKTSNYCVPTD